MMTMLTRQTQRKTTQRQAKTKRYPPKAGVSGGWGWLKINPRIKNNFWKMYPSREGV
jgi:hypothetical protein